MLQSTYGDHFEFEHAMVQALGVSKRFVPAAAATGDSAQRVRV